MSLGARRLHSVNYDERLRNTEAPYNWLKGPCSANRRLWLGFFDHRRTNRLAFFD